ncbi:SIMPL domain-containing protein [Rhodoglobus sp. NPDC076762]
MPLVITVRGEHESWHAAERGIVHLSVAIDGPDRSEVFDAAMQSSGRVHALLTQLASNDGAITRWSSDTVRVTSQRPWNNAGEQLPLVYSAAIGYIARFRDFDALALFIEYVSAVDHTTVTLVEWELTEEATRAALADARHLAVIDAYTKAREYAESVGLSEVTTTAIADPGMLADVGPGSDSAGSGARASLRMMGAAGDGGQLALKPEKISVAASVEARFHAS